MTKLIILCPDTVHPPSHGAAARTLAVARMATLCFDAVDVIGFGPALDAEFHGVRFRHLPKKATFQAKSFSRARMLLSKRMGFGYPRFIANELATATVQIESPFLYPAAQDAGVKHFVYDAHNVYADLAAFPQFTWKEKLFYAVTARRQRRIEAECIRAAAGIIACSARDAERIASIRGATKGVAVVPNCVEKTFEPAAPNTDGPIVFMGTLNYPPNYDAVHFIIHDLAPRNPERQFVIVGGGARPKGSAPNVTFAGFVPDLRTALAGASIAIAPLWHGSGTRLKILEYWASGIPVVSTRKGAEGLDASDGRDLLYAETAQEFTEAFHRIRNDGDLALNLAGNARALVERAYTWSTYQARLEEVYKSVVVSGPRAPRK